MAKTRKMVEERYPGITAWYDSLRNDGTFRDTLNFNVIILDLQSVT